MLKASVLITIGLLCAGTALAEEEGIRLLESGTDINSTESLQRGARNFMNYCSGCHSLKYLRYSRLGADLKIPEAEVVKNLI
ncbi:MAG: ubiquinol-cytochrome c reductase cytochrome c1 subunit, partial [Gammaproteobacteria bacterium]|nr:ubiquinol-cytochrome c reductase cytochrome c1 subunit [Gammaproteobacteria bacterium]